MAKKVSPFLNFDKLGNVVTEEFIGGCLLRFGSMEFPGVLLYCDFIRLFWSLSVGVPSVCSEFETICQADATEMEVPSLFGKLL